MPARVGPDRASLWIYDVTNVANEPPSLLGNTRDGGDNTHSAWATANGDYVVTGEERTGGGIKVYRITDNGNSLDLELTDSMQLPVNLASSVHNQVIVGYRLFNSWYGAGMQVLDIDPKTGLLEFVASYDTGGSVWGIYPFLGEDRIILGDLSEGLLIVALDVEVLGDLDGEEQWVPSTCCNCSTPGDPAAIVVIARLISMTIAPSAAPI